MGVNSALRANGRPKNAVEAGGVGICGEQGGDPASVDFCFKSGLNYVSCSPYRVPIARLAATQSALAAGATKKAAKKAAKKPAKKVVKKNLR